MNIEMNYENENAADIENIEDTHDYAGAVAAKVDCETLFRVLSKDARVALIMRLNECEDEEISTALGCSRIYLYAKIYKEIRETFTILSNKN